VWEEEVGSVVSIARPEALFELVKRPDVQPVAQEQIAALGDVAIGLERQWSGHADGPGARFAGISDFHDARRYLAG
jgi:hypothetical protein